MSITQQHQNSSTAAVWVTTTTEVPVGGLLASPSLAGVRVGGPSGKAPVIDLSSSSDEEGPIADTSRDKEFAKRLFGDLNCDVLGLPGDGKIIILSDSDKEGEVREEKPTDNEVVATSAAVNLASTASADADDAPSGVQNDNSDDRTPDQEADDGNDGGDEAGLP
jgi:hypothetical protein